MPPWLWHTLGYTLASLGALLSLWALFHDRSRGRRRCPKCWYDMSGSPQLTCPECGHKSTSERHLFKTRRRWRWMIAVILLIAAAHILHSQPRIRNEGWAWGLAPTSVLMVATTGYEYAPVGTNPHWEKSPITTLRLRMHGHLQERFDSGQMWNWQARALIRRWGFPKAIQMRDRWPRGVPMTVQLRFDNLYFTAGVPRDLMRVTLVPAASSGAAVESALLYTGRMIMHQDEFTFDGKPVKFEMFQPWRHDIPGPTNNTREVRFHVELFTMASTSPMTWNRWSESIVTRPLQAVDSVDDILKPITGPEADVAAKNMLGVRIWPAKGEVQTWNTTPVNKSLENVTLGYRVEVWHGPDLVAWTARGFEARDLASSGAGFGGGWKMDGDLKHLATADAADPAWRVIVKSDGIEALKILEATNYWKGQFEPDSRSVLKN